MTKSLKKTILLIDDDGGLRSIRMALKDLQDADIVDTNDMTQALALIADNNIQLIVTNTNIGGNDAMDFISALRKKGIEVAVIFVSSQADKNLAIKALRLRAFDFIEKPFQNSSLLATVEKALASNEAEFLPKLENLNLNTTQIKVLEMLMKGLSNKEIAEIVNLSEQGVKYHVGNLFKKFDTSNRTTLRSKILELIGV